MNEKIIRESRHYGRLAFMALVTAYLIAAVFHQAARGTEGMFAAVAFAFAAGFGMEFVTAGWTGRSAEAARRRSVRR